MKMSVAYPFWRFEMWLKGYGTYIEIDEAVNQGKLIPFKDYSYIDTEFENHGDVAPMVER